MIFLGELRETAGMLKGRTLQFFSKIRRDFRRLKKSPAKALSALWLEVQFGWRPFINDIDNLKDAIIAERSHRTRVSAIGKSSPKSVVTTAMVGFGNGGYESMKTSRTTTKSSTRVVGLLSFDKLRAIYDDNRELSRYGFDSSQFIPTLVELIPYSWLVDYFTNIGDIINASQVETRGLVYHVASTKKLTDVEIEYSNMLVPASSGALRYVPGSFQAPSHKARRFTFTRVIPATLVPSFATTYPPLMSTKWVNVLAVAIQKLR
jgi:hypothetical protein